MRIIGIDPGLTHTGWGVVEYTSGILTGVAAGVITPKKTAATARRLADIFLGLQDSIARHRPVCAAVEETFVNRNPRSALLLGQARGIALLAPALAGMAVFEYAANTIKKTVTGVGHADKEQVLMMVRRLLPTLAVDAADAADALAAAVCHAQHAQTAEKWKGYG
jgi:crossover junction endodeoxyribonuclease RuvC